MLKHFAVAAALFASLNSCTRPQASTDTVFVSNEAGYVTLVDGATGRSRVGSPPALGRAA